MKHLSRIVSTVTFAGLLAFAPLPTSAQNTDTRQALIGIMSMDCGVGQATNRFRTVLAASGQAATPVLLELLAGGAPADLRDKIRIEAVARHAKLTDWARRNPDKAHARSFLELTTQERYVADRLDRLDLTYRSNALRGLEIAGPADASDAIRQALDRDPRLTRLGTRALLAMGER